MPTRRKSVKVLRFTGNYRKSRHGNRAEGSIWPVDLKRVPPPKRLSEAQAVIWRATLKAAPAGLLRGIDSALLEVYCQLTDRLNICEAQLANGIMLEGKISPYVQLARQTTALLVTVGDRLGLSPRSRLSLILPEPVEKPDKDDEWGELIALKSPKPKPVE